MIKSKSTLGKRVQLQSSAVGLGPAPLASDFGPSKAMPQETENVVQKRTLFEREPNDFQLKKLPSMSTMGLGCLLTQQKSLSFHGAGPSPMHMKW